MGSILKKSVSTVFFLFIIISCKQEDSIIVATSANMQFAMKELTATFEKETNLKIDLVISSSGKLASQIEQGAPYDIFVSADTKFPEYLYKKGISKNSPQVYAHGKLILWTSSKDIDISLITLTTEAIKKIAIANPKTAPYGKATVAFLKSKGIYDEIKHKLVFGESISQVNQFISIQSVDVGITSQSIKFMKNNQKTGVFLDLDAGSIPQSAILLHHKKAHHQAGSFYDFLYSDKGKKILKKHGYSTLKTN